VLVGFTERFLAGERHGQGETRPIKGTRPRPWRCPRPTSRCAAAPGEQPAIRPCRRTDDRRICCANDLDGFCGAGTIQVPATGWAGVLPPRCTILHSVGGGPAPARRRPWWICCGPCWPGASISGAPNCGPANAWRKSTRGPPAPYAAPCSGWGRVAKLDKQTSIPPA